MSNDINKDLDRFSRLVNVFLKSEKNNPVSRFITPSKLTEGIDVSLDYNGVSAEVLDKILEKIMLISPKSSSSLFFNQLYGGRHSKAVLGDLLSIIINNSMATFKISGVHSLLEKEVITRVSKLIGYDQNFGGTLPTGGSMSNFMSILIARDKVNKTIPQKGIVPNLVAYASENAHYSISKNASFIGLGKLNVRYIKSNNRGQINIEEFKKQIEEDISKGLIPFYLNATAGTTVLGAYDNIKELAIVCKKNKIWLHVDGAFGGTVIFSKKLKFLLDGINQSDSFCFNAHKTLGAPISSSIFLVKNKKYLNTSFNNDASYLYQTEDEDYNLGQTSFECGRKNNALKIWTLWKSIGDKGMSEIVEHNFGLAEEARKYIRSNKDYTLHSFENSLSICFNYKDYDPRDLCTKLYKHSKIMVGFGQFQNFFFIRLVTVNSQNQTLDIVNFFKVLEKFAKENENNIKRRSS